MLNEKVGIGLFLIGAVSLVNPTPNVGSIAVPEVFAVVNAEQFHIFRSFFLLVSKYSIAGLWRFVKSFFWAGARVVGSP